MPDAGEVVARTAAAGMAAGVIDTLQAEALVALAAGGDEQLAAAAHLTLQGRLTEMTAGLRQRAAAVVATLEDGASAELEDLAAAVAELGADLRRTRDGIYDASRPSAPGAPYASARWLARMGEAERHLKEAGDLLDDGMPPDAAAFEVQAADQRLGMALSEIPGDAGSA